MKHWKWSFCGIWLMSGLLISAPSVWAKRKTSAKDDSAAADTEKPKKRHSKRISESEESLPEKAEKKEKKARPKARKETEAAKEASESAMSSVSAESENVERKARRRSKKESARNAEESSSVVPLSTTEKMEELKTRRRSRKEKAVAEESSASVSSAETSARSEAPVALESTPSPEPPRRKGFMDLFGGSKKETARDASSGTHRVDGKLDLNTATQEELEALPGVGPVTARQIIQGRPYQRKDELKKKNLFSEDQYEKVKEEIIAHQGGN